MLRNVMEVLANAILVLLKPSYSPGRPLGPSDRERQASLGQLPVGHDASQALESNP
jgi:hypothetical protein